MKTRSDFYKEIKDLIRKNTDNETTCFFIYHVDLVDFKLFNYHYGYKEGDSLINKIRETIENIETCIYCKYEYADHLSFIIKTSTERSRNDMIDNFKNQVKGFVKREQENYPKYKIEFWCGASLLDVDNFMSSLESANVARLAAKRYGIKNTALMDDNSFARLVHYHDKERKIVGAIYDNRYGFHLQPQVNNQTDKMVSVEVLGRLYDKNGSILSPADFIPVLEENGEIVKFDFRILEKVCEHLRSRLDAGKTVVPTSINLSRYHINNPMTSKNIKAIVDKYNIPSHLLCFELTETMILNDFDKAKELNDRFQEIGYRTSVDDFGAGFSGINIIRLIPVDEIKIDKSFLNEDPFYKERNKQILPAIAMMAKNLGVRTVMEGVETREQNEMIREMGIHIIQGYYYGKPDEPDVIYDKFL